MWGGEKIKNGKIDKLTTAVCLNLRERRYEHNLYEMFFDILSFLLAHPPPPFDTKNLYCFFFFTSLTV